MIDRLMREKEEAVRAKGAPLACPPMPVRL
jgi:hypothetical protein